MKRVCVSLMLILGMTVLAAKVPPELVDAAVIPRFEIEKTGDERTFTLPPLPPRPEMIAVLRCRMSSFGAGGCNWSARVSVNGTNLGRSTAVGLPRLLFREPVFYLKDVRYKDKPFEMFQGSDPNSSH